MVWVVSFCITAKTRVQWYALIQQHVLSLKILQTLLHQLVTHSVVLRAVQ